MSIANYSAIPGQAQREPGISSRKQDVDGRDKVAQDAVLRTAMPGQDI